MTSVCRNALLYEMGFQKKNLLNSHSITIYTGLIQLPGALKPNSIAGIAPILLPKDCGEDHLYNEVIVLPGTGLTSYSNQSEPRDRTLRYAICRILPRRECEEITSDSVDKRSVLYSYSSNGQSTYKGDSGMYFRQKEI